MAFSSVILLYFLIIAIPAVILTEYVSERKKREFLRSLFSRESMQKLFFGYDARIVELKKVLKIIGLFFLLAALAGPRFGAKLMTVKRSGVDVIIAVDVSRSMLAQDMKPNRLERAKFELQNLISKLEGNRIGIIAFAGKPFLQCPLTLDNSAARELLCSIDANLIPVPGTAIGDAIDLAVKSFVNKERKYKALILLTDGEDHDSDPLAAADGAKRDGVKIYTIGFGSAQGELIPETDASGGISGYKKDKSGQTVMTKLDEQTLGKIAYDTGGKYYQATDGEIEVSRVAEDISGMEGKELKSQKYERYEEKFYYFVFAGLVFLLLEMFLPDGFSGKVNL